MPVHLLSLNMSAVGSVFWIYRRSRQYLLLDFLETKSIGNPEIPYKIASSNSGRARNPVTRSMWVLILLVGLSATAYHLYWILIEYYTYEVRTSILLSTSPKVSGFMQYVKVKNICEVASEICYLSKIGISFLNLCGH